MQQQRMHSSTPAWVAAVGLALLLVGCKSGSSGLGGSFFGGGSGDSFGGGSGSSGIIVVGGGSGAAFDAASVATVSNPEPGSLALFGSGLAGLALMRRRRARKS